MAMNDRYDDDNSWLAGYREWQHKWFGVHGHKFGELCTLKNCKHARKIESIIGARVAIVEADVVDVKDELLLWR